MFYIDHKEAFDGKIVIVEIKGALNNETSPDLEAYINKLIEKNKTFILLNAENIEYMSSSGIGLILYIQKKISAHNGFFVIFAVNSEIQTLFNLLGFNKVFTIIDTKEEALQVIEKQIELRDTNGTAIHEKAVETRIDEFHVIDEDSIHEDADKHKTEIGHDTSNEHFEFRSPVVAECAECKSLIRIKKSGTYLCPDCHTEFSVEKDQTVIF